MSGWIKVEKDLSNDPRVLRMASRLRHANVTLGSYARHVVIGSLVTLWWYADTHISDDDLLPIGADQVDELVGLPGFCDLMPPEWLQVIDADCVKLVDYLVHNGTSAKQRALTQKRMVRLRKRDADVTRELRSRDANSVTRPRPREDLDKKKREGVAFAPSVVEGLDQEAWKQWTEYRAKRKPAIKPESARAAAETLAAFGTDQLAVVKNAIANGYQGLFALKSAGAKVNGHDPASKVWEQLLASDGAEPPRDQRIQSAIEAAGGWVTIRCRTGFDEAKLKSKFCEVYRAG
jgi:hypothetical protein